MKTDTAIIILNYKNSSLTTSHSNNNKINNKIVIIKLM